MNFYFTEKHEILTIDAFSQMWWKILLWKQKWLRIVSAERVFSQILILKKWETLKILFLDPNIFPETLCKREIEKKSKVFVFYRQLHIFSCFLGMSFHCGTTCGLVKVFINFSNLLDQSFQRLRPKLFVPFFSVVYASVSWDN